MLVETAVRQSKALYVGHCDVLGQVFGSTAADSAALVWSFVGHRLTCLRERGSSKFLHYPEGMGSGRVYQTDARCSERHMT